MVRAQNQGSDSQFRKHCVPKADCRKYAFLLRYKGRRHIGVAPKETTSGEEKVLRKVEKRLQKMLKEADRYGGSEACRDRWTDALRYVLSIGYEDKKKILGKDRWIWDLSMIALAMLIAVLLIISIYMF